MKIKILFIIFFSGICALNAYAGSSRDLLIQKEMDCIEQNKSNGLTWQDICSTSTPSSDSASIGSQTPKTSTTAFNDRTHTFSISAQNFYYHYAEPQKARKLTGDWDGVEGKYIFRPPQGDIFNTPVFNYYALEGLYATGKNNLDENAQRNTDNSWTKLIVKDVPGYMFDNRLLLGRDFLPLSFLRVTPYTGFGIRYKTDQSADHFNTLDDGTILAGVNRSDLYYYIPTGLTLDLAANNDYELSLNMEYDYLAKGYERTDYANLDVYTLNSSLSTPTFSNQNLRFYQKHGFGGRASLKFLKHFSLVDICFEPYIRYWHINASKAASGFVYGEEYITTDNKNSTVEIGSSVGIQF